MNNSYPKNANLFNGFFIRLQIMCGFRISIRCYQHMFSFLYIHSGSIITTPIYKN